MSNYAPEVIAAMQEIATPQAKLEYAATADKYVYAKDLLLDLSDDVWPHRISSSIAEYFEDHFLLV